MKIWQKVTTFFSVLLVIGALFVAKPAQALGFNSMLVSNTAILAVENDNLNVTDDLFTNDSETNKIDINNSDIRNFRELRGFYPKLGSLIIQNAPYEEVEDIFNIPGLSEKQKDRLEANLDKFIATPSIDIRIEGDERYNPGVY